VVGLEGKESHIFMSMAKRTIVVPPVELPTTTTGQNASHLVIVADVRIRDVIFRDK
jgi:hypothetical protein